MPEFYRISFDADELEALKEACASGSAEEDRKLGEAASGDLENVVVQESRADDMLLIKGTIALFKPGQTILITEEDLALVKKCLRNFPASAPAASAIKKIDASLSSAAERR